ncbi:MAG: amidase family protein [Solirubrobacteraceae bacterium]
MPSGIRRARATTRALLLALALSAGAAPPAGAADLDLERLGAREAAKLMEEGKLTSVELTKAYIARIEALNKRGPGLNAVTQLNADALKDAANLDAERAAGNVRGPGHGLPVLLKDLIDVKGMATTNGNFSLRDSFPAEDSGVAKKLRTNGVIILGKLGLSEWANSFGNQPSGFSNLLGQVVHGLDADQNPSGSSSGTGAAGASAMSMLTIGTETSGSIISPSRAQGLVGLRPTVGLVPGYGIGPISANQDTAGPMDRTVEQAAITLGAIAGPDAVAEAGYKAMFGEDNYPKVIPPAPATVPDYLSALDEDFAEGKRIGYAPGTASGDALAALEAARDALQAAGATIVPMAVAPAASLGDVPLPDGYEQHKSINTYYERLGPDAPVKSLREEVESNLANPMEALKFGNARHLASSASDVFSSGPASPEEQYRTNLPIRKERYWAQIRSMFENGTPDDASDDVVAVLGSTPNGAQAGFPVVTVPMGYTATHRRTVDAQLHGLPYSERTLLGLAYVLEQATKKRKPASELNPSMYRCAKTVPAPPFADRGACNPDYDAIMAKVGTMPDLGFDLETATVEDLQQRLQRGTLTSEDLTKAYLARIAHTNAEGPALQAVRHVDLGTIERAKALDEEREEHGRRSLLHGIPILVDDTVDVAGTPTTAGTIGLQPSTPAKDAALVAKLKKAGAIILGKTNVTELGGVVDSNLPDGYSALGGQVLLPSDTDKTTAGSSAGSAAATAAGLAAAAVGLETSTDSAQLIAPASVAGVVGFKPTLGRISRTGVLGVARSQDAPGAIAKSVFDAALQYQAMAGRDSADPATISPDTAADPANVLAALSTTALRGKRVATVASSATGYAAAIADVQGLGATTETRAFTAPSIPGIVAREFKRDLEAYLSGIPGPGAKTLAQLIDANEASPAEALKYQQRGLTDAAAVDLTDPATTAAYEADRDAGLTEARDILDGILGNGTPEAIDDAEAILVPFDHALVDVADRAGYPLLSVPAGYGTGNAGRNPIGVVLIAKRYGEASLLAAGYAYEQATKVRLAPSVTNPAMFRCVPGSAFFSPHHCHPGDRLYDSPFDEAPAPVPPTRPTPPTPPTDTPPADAGNPLGASSPAPLPVPAQVAPKRLRVGTATLRSGGKALRVTLTLPGTGKVRTRLTARIGGRTVMIGSATRTMRGGSTLRVTVPLKLRGRKALRRSGRLRITIRVLYTPASGAARTTTQTLTVGKTG